MGKHGKVSKHNVSLLLKLFVRKVQPQQQINPGISIELIHCPLDLSHVAGLLGINEVTGELYGVSVDRRDRLVNANWIGRGEWKEVRASEWNQIKDSLNKVVEIPNIPVTGLSETDQPLSVLTLTANSGDKFTGKMNLVNSVHFL
jgi:hypothetical protein